jgi:hypothetical protein
MAGKKIKDELQRIRKPFDMTAEDFFQRMIKIKKYIGLCPGPELQYDDDEMKALFEQACPAWWLVTLGRQQNYPTMTLSQVKAYYKLLETFESNNMEQQSQRNRRGYLGLRGGNSRAVG